MQVLGEDNPNQLATRLSTIYKPVARPQIDQIGKVTKPTVAHMLISELTEVAIEQRELLTKSLMALDHGTSEEIQDTIKTLEEHLNGN